MHHQYPFGWWKEESKGKKHQKGNKEVLPDPTQIEALTSYQPSITEASNDEVSKDSIDHSAREECVARVEVVRQVVDILGWRMNVADGKFKTLEDFTLDETNS